MRSWTPEKLARARTILGRHTRLADACAEMQCTTDALANAFRRVGMDPPGRCLRTVTEDESAATLRLPTLLPDSDVESVPDTKPSERAPDLDAVRIDRLIRFVKSAPRSLEEVCNLLDLSPVRCLELVKVARERGFYVEFAGAKIGHRVPDPDQNVRDLEIPPVIGGRQIVGVISDTHLGSLYCLREQMKDFIHTAYDRGARVILHPGDWLDGCYKHGLWELSHHGIDDQTQDLFETLPRLPGLRYAGITGNHDQTFTDTCGVNVGRFIEGYFKARGRDDVRFYGDRGATLRVQGAVISLWHPRSGGAYASSYPLQKYIEKIPVGHKPQAVLAGHWHRHVSLFERGVHAVACPTFQGGGSAFGKSLGGAPAIGGLILSWACTEGGTMREFDLSYRAYFEKERLHAVEDGFRVSA